MRRSSTILTWMATILFCGAFFFPLWSISLDAPQYPEGMGMRIWLTKITGEKPHDLQNINGLNHYIGMRKIEPDSIAELRFMKYVLGVVVLMGVLAAALRRRALLVAWVITAVVVAVVGLGDFYKWGYDYGHNLDPDAPIKVPGMSYQPPIFGSKQMLNITATSYPALGGLLPILAVGLAVLAFVLDVRKKRRARAGRTEPVMRPTHVAALFAIALVGVVGCSVRPVPIAYGSDTCNHCRMTISDERYGSEIVTSKGKAFKFDSIECMAAFVVTGAIERSDVALYLTTDYERPAVLIDATKAAYLHSQELRSPMGMNLTAFAQDASARDRLFADRSSVMVWEAMLTYVGESSFVGPATGSDGVTEESARARD